MQKYLERSDINKLTSKRAGSKQGNRFNAPLYLAFMLGCAVSKSYSAILPIKSNREIPQEALSHTVKESYQSLFAAELGLDERNVNNDSMVKNIPSPITNGCTDEHLDASMERLVLLSHSAVAKGQRLIQMQFNVPIQTLVSGNKIESIKLWIPGVVAQDVTVKVFFINKEAARLPFQREPFTFETKAVNAPCTTKETWSFLDISLLSTKIPDNAHVLSVLIKEIVVKLEIHLAKSTIKVNEDRSFLSFELNKRTLRRRKRRQPIDCTPGTTTCCRDKLVIDFQTDAGLSQILRPKKFEAYRCRGSCPVMHGLTPGVGRVSLLRRLKNPKIKFCCTPVKYSGLSILYFDDQLIRQKYISDMKVEECGCQ